MGLLRGELLSGCSAGFFSICCAKSGEALIKNQPPSFVLRATLDCVCGEILPARTATQFGHEQFHCGKPPPAALPRMRSRINYSGRSNGSRVARALEKDRDAFRFRFDPLFLGVFHKLRLRSRDPVGR